MSCVEKETTTLFSVPLLCCLVLEVVLTRLMDKQGTNLFDIYDPQVLPQEVSIETEVFKLNLAQTRGQIKVLVIFCFLLFFFLRPAGLHGDCDGFWFPPSPSG